MTCGALVLLVSRVTNRVLGVGRPSSMEGTDISHNIRVSPEVKGYLLTPLHNPPFYASY